MASFHFDLLSGASGDMILATFVDCGVPIEHVQSELGKMHLHGLSVTCEQVTRSNLAGTRMVIDEGESHVHRHVQDILDIMNSGHYPVRVSERAEKVLMRLAQAEAKVHGIPIEKVHFHEIGAVDTIIDIMGACLCMEHLNIDTLTFGALTEGHGTIKVAHGVMPVPAPATARLIEGFTIKILDIPTEILTPTGAALLTTLGSQVATIPSGTITKVGYGCGTKVFNHHPNMLRGFLMNSATSVTRDDVIILESDMDHLSGEIMGYAADRLMQSGALDVSWTPIFMKKGRPGYRIAVISSLALADELTRILMAETRTLGVRKYSVERTIAPRIQEKRILEGRELPIKKCSIAGKEFTKFEYEDLAEIARVSGRPLIEIMEELKQ